MTAHLPVLTEPRIPGARQFSASHPAWLCDVWGVVHDGERANPAACAALIRHRSEGGVVVLITNAPRRSPTVTRLFRAFGVPEGTHDAIVSSGDVTRRLIEERSGQNIHHMGPARDRDLLQGLPVTFTPLGQADAVVCTGLPGDEDDPALYDGDLHNMVNRALPMICANPDKVVHVGDRLYPCAGAIAERYAAMGGVVEMAGKPHAPIYHEALRLAGEALGRPVTARQALAIGDGLSTDIAGAAQNGIDALFIAGGIHREEIAAAGDGALPDLVTAAAPGVKLCGIMDALAW